MTSWTNNPVLQGLTVLLFTLAITLLSTDAATAQSGSSIRLAQTFNTIAPLPGRSGKGLVIQGIVKKPVRITPSVTGPTPTPPTYQPRPKPPVIRWPKPKQPAVKRPRPKPPVIARPRPKQPAVKWPRPAPPRIATPGPGNKNVANPARRYPPRRITPPPIIQQIPQFIVNQVAVLIDGSQPAITEDELAQALGLSKLSSVANTLLEGRLVTYAIPGNQPLPQVIATLSADPRVRLAQPNNIYLTVGNSSRGAAASAQYSLAKLALPSAHKISQGRGVPVAVIDTGIDISHPALASSVSRLFDAVGDGHARAQSHGTAIAGLIAGQGKVKGVAPLSSLYSVRAFHMHPVYKRPVTSSAILLRALDWAFVNKARIFNLSFAGPFDPLVKAALASASNKGVILVAAAGNGGPKAAPAYPAAYENVIAITALDHKDKIYTHANHGSYLTAAAPGVDVLVPSLKKGYRYSSGTSLAAAHISGLIALLLERHPEASAEAVVNAIRSSAHDLGPTGHDAQFGAGRADAHASLLSMTRGEVQLTSGQ